MDVKKLKKAFQEIIDLTGLTDEKTGDPITIAKNADEDALVNGIKDAIQYIEPTDQFLTSTQTIIDEVKEMVEEEAAKASKPTKGKKKKEVEVEPIEEIEEEEIEEEEEENEVEDNSELTASVEEAETVKELKAIAKEHADLFADVDLKIKDVDELRDEMLMAIEEAGENTEEEEDIEEAEEEEVKPMKQRKVPEKKIAPAPDKKSKKVAVEETEEEEVKPVKSGKKPAPAATKKSSAKEGQLESFQSIADRLLAEKATEKVILSTFAKLYKDRKGIVDPEFTAKRAKIYMDIAKKKK